LWWDSVRELGDVGQSRELEENGKETYWGVVFLATAGRVLKRIAMMMIKAIALAKAS